MQVTALTITGHKFHGPRGVGALLLQRSARIDPILFGGFQQMGLRPGTEPLELAVGLHHALQVWQRDAQTRAARMSALRDRFEQLLRDAAIGVVINGLGARRLPHTSNVAFPGLDCQAVHMALDMAGVACSIGSACASGSTEPSTVLLAMRLPDDIVESSLRFSLGAFTTRQDIDTAADRIIQSIRRLHKARQTQYHRRHDSLTNPSLDAVALFPGLSSICDQRSAEEFHVRRLAPATRNRYNRSSARRACNVRKWSLSADGVWVVSGVFSIPLEAYPSPSHEAGLHGTPRTITLREYIGSDENRLVQFSVESLLASDRRYNPIVFVGPSGTGKSLLAVGLAERWRRERPGQAVFTTCGADFARSFAYALDTDSLADWRARTCAAELFVLDDLQQMCQKPAAQEELARLLDQLLDDGRAVLVTASQAPSVSGGLLPGLCSRLSGGLTVPLLAPGIPGPPRTLAADRRPARQCNSPMRPSRLLAIGPTDAESDRLTVPQLNHAVVQLGSRGARGSHAHRTRRNPTVLERPGARAAANAAFDHRQSGEALFGDDPAIAWSIAAQSRCACPRCRDAVGPQSDGHQFGNGWRIFRGP